MTESLHGLVVADFNAANLASYLTNNSDAPQLTAAVPGFAQSGAVLADARHECWLPRPAYAVVWTRPDTTIGAFRERLQNRTGASTAILDEVDEYADRLIGVAERTGLVLVPTWTFPGRGLGMLDLRPDLGIGYALMQMNLRLAERLSRTPNVFLLDAERWISAAGSRAWSDKAWYLGKIPFDNAVFKAAVADIKAAVRGAYGQARKLVIVDADDTLWGGVVGDVGWEALRVGGHDPHGEAFLDFQRGLKALKERGVLLGLVSKNEEPTVREALTRHPEMALRLDDFAALRVNWSDKAQNVASLIAELNLGPQSAVFLDDHPVERARVREALPEVFVPELPEDKLLVPSFLAALRCFDSPARTAEDLSRSDSYALERKRQAAREAVGNAQDWLKTLEMKVLVEPLADGNLERTAQLLNKTNQMNLSTRRMTAGELRAWASAPHHRLWTLRVSDKFGDYGLVGIISAELDGRTARVVDFVLSCRVIGRQVEEAMLRVVQMYATAENAECVEARLLPTPKNAPCLRWWQQSGWRCSEDTLFAWSPELGLAETPALDVQGISAPVTA